jgi:hypothetical protein
MHLGWVDGHGLLKAHAAHEEGGSWLLAALVGSGNLLEHTVLCQRHRRRLRKSREPADVSQCAHLHMVYSPPTPAADGQAIYGSLSERAQAAAGLRGVHASSRRSMPSASGGGSTAGEVGTIASLRVLESLQHLAYHPGFQEK